MDSIQLVEEVLGIIAKSRPQMKYLPNTAFHDGQPDDVRVADEGWL